MSSIIDYAASRASQSSLRVAITLRDWRCLPLAAVFFAAMVVRHFVVSNTDVSWLITVSEKMLEGQRLYVDLIEVNPPATVLLYLPPVAFARVVGLAPELVIDAFVFLAIGANLWISGRLLTRAGLLNGIDGARLAALAALVLAILPAQTFGEREHIVVIVLLPAFAVWAVRLSNIVPDRMATVFAGFGIGIALSIKPHFILAIVPAVISVAIIVKSWRPIFGLENWIGGTLVALYAGSVFLFFPAFVSEVMPMVMAAYVPVRHSLFILSTRTPVWVLCALLLWLITRCRPGALRSQAYVPLLAAACGFAAVFLNLGKGWPYHSYPLLATILLILAHVLSSRVPAAPAGGGGALQPWERRVQVAMTVVFAAVVFYWMNWANSLTALNEPIRRLGEHPRMLVIGSDISVGHPLVREVGGRWVSRVSTLWLTAGVIVRSQREKLDLATARQLADYAKRDRDMLEEDIRRNRPDVVVVDQSAFDWLAWAKTYPRLSAQLRAYREVTRIQKYLILQRRKDPALP